MRFLSLVAVIAMAVTVTWLAHQASISPTPDRQGDVVEEALDYFQPALDLW